LCQNGGLPDLSSTTDTKESRVGADDMFLVKKFLAEKGSVIRYVVMQQPVLLSPKFGKKSSLILMQSWQNVTVVYGIESLACQDEFSVNNPLMSKKMVS
jgi:hypothetical protein